jgi:hypothetical protein
MTAFGRVRYDSQRIEVGFVKIRWLILFFPVVSVIVLSLLVKQHAAKTAPPQGAGPAPVAASK